jgi:sulfoquinovose isomerase
MLGNHATPVWTGTAGPRFVDRRMHRQWLFSQARTLFDFFQFNAFNPKGGFSPLADDGQPLVAAGTGGGWFVSCTKRPVWCIALR